MSCNDVCVVMEYNYSNEFYAEAIRRAAKPHKCCECGAPIVVGESYAYARGKAEGDFWAQCTCAACYEIRTVFTCGCWVFGELWESIRDQVFNEWNDMTAIDCLARLEGDAAVEKMRVQHNLYLEARA